MRKSKRNRICKEKRRVEMENIAIQAIKNAIAKLIENLALNLGAISNDLDLSIFRTKIREAIDESWNENLKQRKE